MSVTTEQWLADTELLLLAAMYGIPPGGWSDPERNQQFLDGLTELEARMRMARDEIRKRAAENA